MAKKILVIEDSELDRKALTRFLNRAGFENLVFAVNGGEGIRKAKEETPDLVLLDTILPGMDGFEVCHMIRGACGPTTPKIIMMTGAVEAVDAVKAKEMGADDYCAKTSDFAPLLEIVTKLIQG